MTSIDYLRRPVTQVRRRDRALTDEAWIDRFLSLAPIGHLALCWEGEPLLHSNIFWFDGQRRIYFHTAGVGRFRAVLAAGGPLRACFSVTEQGRLLPAGTPLDFSTEYASVQAYGPLRLVEQRAEKKFGLEGLMVKYAPQLQPGVDYEPMPDGDIDQTSVYCFEIEERVGKHNVKPDDYPAYPYPGGSFIDEERAAGRVTVRPKELA
jgi:nitroimidazol reductase NimA-like FMN-containing flavoprotein (pyridoxamine 5'-phosphate oxidase superfamily)